MDSEIISDQHKPPSPPPSPDALSDLTHSLSAATDKSHQASLREALASISPPLSSNAAAGEITRNVGFHLVIASDVVYSLCVVKPLFDAVHGLLSDGDGKGGWREGGRRKQADHGCSAPGAVEQQRQQQPCSLIVGGGAGGGDGAVPAEVTVAPRPEGAAGAGFPPPSDGASTNNTDTGRAATAGLCITPGGTGCEDVNGRCGNSSSSSSATNNDGAVCPPVFVMSQSFGYDSETESAIDHACSQRGLIREVVWDELGSTPATGHQSQQAEVPAAEQICGRRSEGVVEGGDGNCCDVGLPLSRRWRAGTKLQLFWRA